jgi:hypothetical protein
MSMHFTHPKDEGCGAPRSGRRSGVWRGGCRLGRSTGAVLHEVEHGIFVKTRQQTHSRAADHCLREEPQMSEIATGPQLRKGRLLLCASRRQLASLLLISDDTIARAETDWRGSTRTQRQLQGVLQRNGVVFGPGGGVHLAPGAAARAREAAVALLAGGAEEPHGLTTAGQIRAYDADSTAATPAAPPRVRPRP